MFAEERQYLIAERVKRNGKVLVSDLSSELGVSLPTIRRDLDELERKSIIKKIHGGAIATTEELPFSERNIKNHREKVKIAETASGLVCDNDIIFLDAGTTVFQMVSFIKDRSNTVVLTNSIKTAVALLNYPNIVTNLIGGAIKPVSYATVGAEAIANIKRYKVNKLFLGADGVGDDNFTVQDINEAYTKQAMLEIASERYLLVDSSKIGKPTFVEVGKLKGLTKVITENDVLGGMI